MDNIKIHRIPLGSYQSNCYLIENVEENNAVIIDCGDGLGFQEYINKNDLKFNINYGLITHGHFDHVMGVEYVQQRYGTMFFISLEDFQAQYDEPYLFPKLKNVNIVYDSLTMNLGNFKINTIATPGHTMGGMTYKFENHIFTGDTLFKDGIGRTDLYGGNYDILIKSIKERLFTLPKDTIIHSGHGEESTIGDEMENNKYIV